MRNEKPVRSKNALHGGSVPESKLQVTSGKQQVNHEDSKQTLLARLTG